MPGITRRLALGGVAALLVSTSAHAILFSGAPVSGGGGGSTLTAFTLLTTDGSNIPANGPFEFGVMLAPGALSAGQALSVSDAGGNVVSIQQDNVTTDYSSAYRFWKVTGVLPNAPGASNTNPTLNAVTGSPNTSNPISVANLLAQTISTDTFECEVVGTMPSGTVYTAKATDALSASSAWAVTAAQNRGTFRQGPHATEWIVSAPMVTGGTPHPFWRAWFHITAYKASSAAWNNTTNPITGVKCLVILENGYIDVSGGGDLVYDLQILMGATAQTPWLTLNGSTPSATLTLGGTSGQTNAVLSTGTWAAPSSTSPNSQDPGKAVVEIGGSGRGYLMGRNSTTDMAVCIPTATPFASTSKTSGQWRTMGVYQPYMMRFDTYGSGHGYFMTPWWGTSQKTVAALPESYVQASKMIMNYGANQTSAGNPDLSAVNNCGSHPMAVNFPTGRLMNYGMSEAATGDADHIGVLSFSFCAGLMNWTYAGGQHLNARQLVFQNSRVGNLKPFFFRDSTTGGVVPTDQAGVYYNSGQQNGGIGLPANDYTGGTGWYIFALNHSPGCSYLPYLFSGDFMHLETGAAAAADYSLRTSGSGVFTSTAVTLGTASSSVTIGSGYPQQTGEAVVVECGGFLPQISGVNLNRANMYFVNAVDATHIVLYDTRANALAGGGTGQIVWSSAGTQITIRNGYGKNALPEAANGVQPREQAWNNRTINQLLMVMPDNIGSLIDYSRTKAGVQRQYNAMGLYMNQTYAQNVNFVAGGPRYLGLHGVTSGGLVFPPWQNNYMRLTNINAYEGGVMNSDWLAFHTWFLADQMQWAVNASNEQTYFMNGGYYIRAQTNSGVNQYTYSGIAQEAMRAATGDIAYGLWTQTGQSASVSSAASQTAVVVDLAATFFDTVNPSRHVGSWLIFNGVIDKHTTVIFHNANFTMGNPLVLLSSTTGFVVGMGLTDSSGVNASVPSGATVSSIVPGVSITMSAGAVSTSTRDLIGQSICGQITQVNNATQCVIDTTVTTWDGTSTGNSPAYVVSAAPVLLPWPSWGNQASIVGTDLNYGGGNQDSHYLWLANSGIEIAEEMGIDTSNYAAAVAFMATKGLPSNPPSAAVVTACATALKGNVVHR